MRFSLKRSQKAQLRLNLKTGMEDIPQFVLGSNGIDDLDIFSHDDDFMTDDGGADSLFPL